MSPDFKTTSCPVALDFLIRHEVITPENGKNKNPQGLVPFQHSTICKASKN